MSKAFGEIAEEQGWNQDSMLAVMSGFIAERGLMEALDERAQEVADEENGVEHRGRKVPDFQADVPGEYQGNAYPEPGEYRIRIAPHDEEFFLLTVETTDGTIVGSTSLGPEEIDGIDKAATTDYGAPLEDGDWTFPAGMNIVLTWVLQTDMDHYVVIDEGHIDQIAHWFRYATGVDEWNWDEQGEEWEF